MINEAGIEASANPRNSLYVYVRTECNGPPLQRPVYTNDIWLLRWKGLNVASTWLDRH